jgi:hypothetical protein
MFRLLLALILNLGTENTPTIWIFNLHSHMHHRFVSVLRPLTQSFGPAWDAPVRMELILIKL